MSTVPAVRAKSRGFRNVREPSVQVRHDDRARAPGECVRKRAQVDIHRVGIDVDVVGDRGAGEDRRARIAAGVRHGDDDIAGTHAGRAERDFERIGAVRDTERMTRSASRGEGRLERPPPLAENEGAGIEDFVERLPQLLPVRFVQPPKVVQRDHAERFVQLQRSRCSPTAGTGMMMEDRSRRRKTGACAGLREMRGAQKRTRTSTVLPPPGPEPGASTNSAIWASVTNP